MNVLELEPNSSSPYSCPPVSIRAGKRFRARAIVYKDSGTTNTVASLNRLIELQFGVGGPVELIGRPAD